MEYFFRYFLIESTTCCGGVVSLWANLLINKERCLFYILVYRAGLKARSVILNYVGTEL